MSRLFKAETLIKEIEKRPFIWNKSDTDYHNFVRKDNAWKEICAAVYKNWDTSNNTTRQEMCNEVKKKWANIRDNYRKCLLKKLTSERAGFESAPRTYVYAKYLKFLNTLLKAENKKIEFETVSYDESNTDDDKEEKDDTEEEQNVEYLDQEEHTIQDVLDIKYEPEEPVRKRRRTSYQVPNSPVVQSSQNAIEIDTEDDDTLFLLSFRSNMKLMDHDQKIEFKLGMLQLLKQIR